MNRFVPHSLVVTCYGCQKNLRVDIPIHIVKQRWRQRGPCRIDVPQTGQIIVVARLVNFLWLPCQSQSAREMEERRTES